MILDDIVGAILMVGEWLKWFYTMIIDSKLFLTIFFQQLMADFEAGFSGSRVAFYY